ncbi:MAG: amidohydrolase [Elusimicrobia bacterium]|nr:amidohydrolase [Elusimicrobiota bacterium]MBU2614922.1 amidohydrolase [Elusimicrobiota bacterium]
MENLQKKLVSIRRQIHQNPELGNQEIKTTKYINSILKSYGIQTRILKQSGLIAHIPSYTQGQKVRKVVAFRADIDALPIEEKTKKHYQSKNKGVMHACGHDAHTAMLIGAAILLKQNEAELKKSGCIVKLIFQPNEEQIGGALDVIKAGALKNPPVDCIFGLHVHPEIPTNTIGFKYGQMMASSDKFELKIYGGGGHGAYPYLAKDVIFTASELIVSLKSLVQRKIHPATPAVVSVCMVHGGARPNIFPESIELTGTVRTLDEIQRRKMPKLIEEIIKQKTAEHKLKYGFKYFNLCPVVDNDNKYVDNCIESAKKVVKRNKIVISKKPTMGSEDFSEYLQFVPGCFMRIGTQLKGAATALHHAEFDIDESILITGAKLFAQIAEDQMSQNQ